ncbi:hypothetical protein [Microlunatus parietis]|uniref:Uncharacterized protein n=1 Tax=Microlunatus parietis TaxID=682979 RepID=A0A7Y9I8K8_9ACTN|nr:hypothetical protein [Microlunatus parietis]NYE72008.1 hypothetical protein [Microlunatus parietis]
MINELQQRGRPQPGRSARVTDRPLILLAGLAGLFCTVLAAVWLAVPATNLMANTSGQFNAAPSLLNGLFGPAAATGTLLGTGLIGVLTAAILLFRGPGSLPSSVVIMIGIAVSAVIGIGILNETAIMMAGYLMALAVVAGSVLLVVQLVRKFKIGRWLALAAVAVIVSIFATGLMPAESLLVLAGRVAGLGGRLGDIAIVFALAATTLLWLLVAARTAQRSRLLDRPAAWVLRHRRVITILAALGPLPYCLIRLTWLTPWPYGGAEGLTPDTRIWGVLLSSGGWAGLILTLGLIARWGEVFPRWVPFFAGRPVPVWAAAGPGSFVAAILLVSAIPMIRAFATEGVVDGLVSAVIFPFWFWGPMLSLAVWGYVLHRRTEMNAPTAQ